MNGHRRHHTAIAGRTLTAGAQHPARIPVFSSTSQFWQAMKTGTEIPIFKKKSDFGQRWTGTCRQDEARHRIPMFSSTSEFWQAMEAGTDIRFSREKRISDALNRDVPEG
jgi:hypothetical protein